MIDPTKQNMETGLARLIRDQIPYSYASVLNVSKHTS